MLFFLLCLSCLSYVYGGSKCVNRSNIYPCICIDRPIGKTKFDTTVICQGLTHGESLTAISPGLSSMDMDHFLLYDSYWSTNSRLLQANARVPVNILTTFKIKEIKIVDTVLETFACPETDNCNTNYVKRFIAINSSVSESSSCNGQLSIKSWVSCPEKIESFTIDGVFKSDITLKPEFFPDTLTKLEVLHMPHNRIVRIDKRAFQPSKFPALHTLDLSHNVLRDIRSAFSSILKVKYLDLSYNYIRTMPDFQYLPNLQFLNVSHNNFLNLSPNEWDHLPAKLRTLDLTMNKLNCDCSTKWINGTFHINTNIMGTCAEPHEVANMKIRRASRLVNERCDANNNILPSKLKTHRATPSSTSA